MQGETVTLVHRSREGGEQAVVMQGLHAAQDAWLALGEAVRHLSQERVVTSASSQSPASDGLRQSGRRRKTSQARKEVHSPVRGTRPVMRQAAAAESASHRG